ncbi:GNAT family N-acetyltransferase [Kordia zhangzhouensis]|uniref:GNAT family N-acetyltransferase n=1 Tax=Kordia zhangzhouensis TaxID=1620405 RepID=UPI0006292BE6|nr:GNAT family N-acetyltransferase [Kordia zhangzhouensis]
MKTILETKRLLLREFTVNDAEFILELVNTPLWLEFIGDKNIRNKENAIDYIENRLQKSYINNGYGLWLMQLKVDATPIGMCGLLNRESLEDIDIGFALLPEHERKGYTYEAAKATLTYAEKVLQIPKVVAITNTNNIASIRLLNKLGLQFDQELLLSEDDPVLLFS